MRVVIADDSKLIRQQLRAQLTNLGHQVVGEAQDGFQAKILCQQMCPDLVILDKSMPGDEDGAGAAKRIRDAKTATWIMLCTSRSSTKSAAEAEGFSVLIKPIMQGVLAQKIAQLTQVPPISPPAAA